MAFINKRHQETETQCMHGSPEAWKVGRNEEGSKPEEVEGAIDQDMPAKPFVRRERKATGL